MSNLKDPFASPPQSVPSRLPFLTDSHAYGTPRPDSDVDLCLYLDCSTSSDTLVDFERVHGPLRQLNYEGTRFYLLHGPLNLIVFTDTKLYDLWLKITNDLIAQKPVTREVACAAFNAVGLTGGSGTHG